MRRILFALAIGIGTFGTFLWVTCQNCIAAEWRAKPDYFTPEDYYKPSPLTPKYSLEVVPETYWFYYDEPPISIKTVGVLYGIRATYTRHEEKTNPFMTRLEGRYSAGGSDYDGSLSDGTPHKERDENYTYEIRGLVGYDLEFHESFVTPYVGLGYRYWFNDGESRFAYERNISYLYLPLGVESASFLNTRWIWGIRAEFDLFIRGWVKSHLSDVNSSFNDLENRQKRGFGLRGSVYFKRPVGEKTDISIEPFIRYWDIDDSDTAPVTFAGTLIGGGYEPANRTVESGLQVSIIF